MNSGTKKDIDSDHAGDPEAQTKSEHLRVLSIMEKALCRQHIMWPHNGKLPCELDQACAKSHLCSQMAREAVEFSRQLDANSEN